MNIPSQPEPGPRRPTDSGAVTSMVLGIVGIIFLFPLGPFLGPASIALGHRAKKRIAASGTVEGMGYAQAGYILGIVGSVMAALGLIFFGICIAVISSSGF